MSLVGSTFPGFNSPPPAADPTPAAQPQSDAGLPSIYFGQHISPRIPGTSGRPQSLETYGSTGDPNGYPSIKEAISAAGVISDMSNPAVAVVEHGGRFLLQNVNTINDIGATQPYTPDELVDFGELKVRFHDTPVKAVVDGWTELTP